MEGVRVQTTGNAYGTRGSKKYSSRRTIYKLSSVVGYSEHFGQQEILQALFELYRTRAPAVRTGAHITARQRP